MNMDWQVDTVRSEDRLDIVSTPVDIRMDLRPRMVCARPEHVKKTEQREEVIQPERAVNAGTHRDEPHDLCQASKQSGGC